MKLWKNKGTDQFSKQGYRSKGKTGVQIRKSWKNGGTDQFFWRAKPGYRSVFLEGKTRVQINSQNRGTDQFPKQGYRSRKSRKTRGTDQFFWRAKQGYRSPSLDGKVKKLIFQHNPYVGLNIGVMLGL